MSKLVKCTLWALKGDCTWTFAVEDPHCGEAIPLNLCPPPSVQALKKPLRILYKRTNPGKHVTVSIVHSGWQKWLNFNEWKWRQLLAIFATNKIYGVCCVCCASANAASYPLIPLFAHFRFGYDLLLFPPPFSVHGKTNPTINLSPFPQVVTP